MNINVRSVIFINGIIVFCLSVLMLLPLLFDILFCNCECINVFTPSIFSGIFLGGLMFFSCKTSEKLEFSRKEIFLLVVAMWTITSIVCAFPFYIYKGVNLSFASALFESVSGITTTGATIYQDVEMLPRAINFWRFTLHFLGGVGIVAIGIIVLPIMRIGGMQLFTTENSDNSQKFLPRASQIVSLFCGLYVFLIALFTFLLRLAGMGLFDSLCHSISMISTGGFSTKNIGIEWFESSKIRVVCSIGMFIGGITFLEIIRSFKSGIKTFFSNKQILSYLTLTTFFVSVPIITTTIFNTDQISAKGISTHIFQIISAITTTGLDLKNSYVNSNVVLVLLAIVGGCSGSTTGGIKIFRVQILFTIAKNQLRKIVRPFDVTTSKYQDSKIDDNLRTSIISFIVFLIMVFAISTITMETILDHDFEESIRSIFSCLFNLGYGLNVSDFTATSKLILIMNMLIGRLEIIPFILVITSVFWKR